MFKSLLKKKVSQPLIILFLGILFVILSRFNIFTGIRSAISYVFEPIAVSASNLQSSVSSWGSLLFDANSYIEENRKLREEILNIRSKEGNLLDLEEYEALKLHESVFFSDSKYVLAKVLGTSQKGDIYLNVGTKDEIKEGDTASLGKVFLGTISAVDRGGSIVKLPVNRESSFEVAVLDSSVEEVSSLDGYIKSIGVITGDLDSIKIENIGINSDVVDGDLVVLRDERIGEILIVGRVVGLSKNPASTSKSGFVSPIFDYSNLISVFVKIK